MAFDNNARHLSTVNDNIYVQDLEQNDVRYCTHLWGNDPTIYLEETRQQSRVNKFLGLRESLTIMSHISASHKTQQNANLHEVTKILENLKSMRILLASQTSNIDNATQCTKEIAAMVTDLLLRVVHQIGQTNVHTPTLDSSIAYIRNFMHAKSEHMRQVIPGSLLISWYELSNLTAFIQHEPEIRITPKKALQLIDVASETAAWTYAYLTANGSHDQSIGFKDRASFLDTYE